MIKLKDLLEEGSPGYENRQFGDPLPTLSDITKKYQEANGTVKEESVDEEQKRQSADLDKKFDTAFLNFSREINDIIKMMDRISGGKTDGEIINKSYKKHLLPFDKLFKSWAKGQQQNPHIDEEEND